MHGEGWEEEVVFTGAEQVVDKESEEEPIPVSCPVEIGSECSKMSCNMFEIYIRLEKKLFCFFYPPYWGEF